MATLPDGYTEAETVAAMQAAAAANGGGDYKALVCFFMFGGMDSHNLLVPRGTNPNLSIYQAARAAGARIEPGEVLALTGSADWGLHPKLDRLRDAYNAGSGARLAVVRNVGTLDRPITKAEYLVDPRVAPDQLFAHNIQQDIWLAALEPNVARTTGWFGRAANLIDPYFNVGQLTPSSALANMGGVKQAVAHLDTPASLIPPTVLTTPGSYGAADFANVWSDLMRHDGVVTRKTAGVRNMVYETYGSVFTGAIDRQAALGNATTGLIALPGGDGTAIDTATPSIGASANMWRAPIKEVCRAMLSRAAGRLNQRRQIFFVGVGGWDHHSNLRAQHDVMIEHFDNAVAALAAQIAAYGLTNNVVFFTETEFSRTLTSNATGGTDHAWAGHSFVVGGPVINGLYGPEPDYTVNGPRDTGSGRYIPDISIEQYYATLLRWFGVPEAQLPLILPNLPAFSPRTIGFLP